MRAQKITKHNYNSYNDQGIDSVPVKARFFNDLYDDVVELISSLQTEDVELSGDVDSILGYISTLQTAVGTAGQLSPVVRTNNPTLTGSALYSNIDKLDAAIGVDATPVSRSIGPIVVANSVNSNIDALDVAIGANMSPVTRTTGQCSTGASILDNIDSIDTVIGFDAQLSGSPNLISRSQTIYQNLDALDYRLKTYKTIISTAGGTGTGQFAAVEHHANITSISPSNKISLPLLTAFMTGAQISGVITSNTGCQLHVHPSDQVGTKYINGATGGNHIDLTPSNSGAYFEAVKVNISKWIVKGWSNVGTSCVLTPTLL
jgi:hypothetical protein